MSIHSHSSCAVGDIKGAEVRYSVILSIIMKFSRVYMLLIRNICQHNDLKMPSAFCSKLATHNGDTGMEIIHLVWGSSVSIVSDYRLDDRGSISSRGKGLFL
jgi:hypothetical protein